jgi:hypothetical protein
LPGYPIGPTRVAWANETQKIFAQLRNLKTQGLLVQPVPEFASDIRYEVTVLKKNVIGEDRIVLNRENEILNRMDTNAVMKVFDNRSILNLYSQLCNANLCSQVKNGKFMYEDGSHLSSVGSMVLVPEIEGAIRTLVQKGFRFRNLR